MSVHNIQFHYKIRKFPYIFFFLSYQKNSQGLKNKFELAMVNKLSVFELFEVRLKLSLLTVYPFTLTIKMPRKPASENIVCLCRLLNILANFSNLFLHTGKQCGP